MECKDCQNYEYKGWNKEEHCFHCWNYKPKQHQLDELVFNILKKVRTHDAEHPPISTMLKKLRYESIKWGMSQRLEGYIHLTDIDESFDKAIIAKGHKDWIVED